MSCEVKPVVDQPFSNRLSFSQDKAKKIFYHLGENWWKQIFDGKYHQFGKMVFDEGLHPWGTKEPGFYQSAFNAFNFAGDQLRSPNTPELYCKIHQLACSHFMGKNNNTQMMASEAGQMRTKSSPSTSYRVELKDFIKFYLDRIHLDPNQDKLLDNYLCARRYDPDPTSEPTEEFQSLLDEPDYPLSLEMFKKINQLRKTGIKRLTEHFQCLKKITVGGVALPTVSLNGDFVEFEYANYDYFPIIQKVLKEFDTNIQKAQSSEDKLELIAALYQLLEWFHPFRDGQGRTDLIFLSKLLAENGLNPPVLFDPYVSTLVPLKEWTEVLREGMEAWKSL